LETRNEIEARIFKEISLKYNNRIVKYEAIEGSGSERLYFRVHFQNSTIIAVFSKNIRETRSFLYFSEVFRLNNMPVPRILGVSDNLEIYFTEDLGTISLLDYINTERKMVKDDKGIIEIYKKVIDKLLVFQFDTDKKINYSNCYLRQSFDERMIKWDLNYFKYYFLKLSGIPFDEEALEDDFNILVRFLMQEQNYVFMYRDFQARNIIIKDGNPYFIDYQGGMKGPPEYDLASLLYQSKANLKDTQRQELLDYYVKNLSEKVYPNKEDFTKYFYPFVLIRICQTLGAYGYRGLIEKKEHFISSIPGALNNLVSVIPELLPDLELTELFSAIRKVYDIGIYKEREEHEGLRLTICSFSFKKGFPEDKSGNGGGFVFDCRALPNPGRYDEYKKLNGKDPEVQNFLRSKSEVSFFIDKALELVEKSVEVYLVRGFNDLMVNFGCTGGQHRSVFCAEQLRNKLIHKYNNIEIVIKHKEIDKLNKKGSP